MPQGFDPIAELNKRYPDTAKQAPGKAIEYLSDPANFRQAFPEYKGLDDATIKRNMAGYQGTGVQRPAAPAHPQEPFGGKLWDRISGEYIPEAMHALIATPKPPQMDELQAIYPRVGGMLQGAVNTAFGLPSVVNAGLALTGGLEEKLGLGVVGKISSLVFGGLMAKGSAESGKAAYESWQQGDKSGAYQHGTEAVLGAGMAGAAITHGVERLNAGNPAVSPAEGQMGADPSRPPVNVPKAFSPTPRTATPPPPIQTPAKPSEPAVPPSVESKGVTTPVSQMTLAQLRKAVEGLPDETPPVPIVGQGPAAAAETHASVADAQQAVRDEKPGEDLPRPLGQSIKSQLPAREPGGTTERLREEASMEPRTTWTPPVKPEAAEEEFIPKEKVKPGQLPMAADRAWKALQKLAPGADRAPLLAQWHDAMNSWTRGVAREDLETLHAPAWDERAKKTAAQAEFLDKNLKFGDDKLRQAYEDAMNAKAAGVGHLKAPQEGKAGPLESGITHSAREAIDMGLGKRRTTVNDLVFARAAAKALAKGTDIDLTKLPEGAYDAARQEREQVKEMLADKVAMGTSPGEAMVSVGGKNVNALEHLEALDLLLGREPIKTTGAGGEAAFEKGAAAKGLTGKAIEPHEGLPVLTRKIWQDMLETKKHVALPTRAEREAQLLKLQERQQFAENTAALLRKRAGEKGMASTPGIQSTVRLENNFKKLILTALDKQGSSGRMEEDLSQLALRSAALSRIDHGRIEPGRDVPEAAWITPDGEHFISAINDVHADVMARLLTGEDWGALTDKVGEKKANKLTMDMAKEVGFIRRANRGNYDIHEFDSTTINTLQRLLAHDIQEGLVSPIKTRSIFIDSGVGKRAVSFATQDYIDHENNLTKTIGRAFYEQRAARGATLYEPGGGSMSFMGLGSPQLHAEITELITKAQAPLHALGDWIKDHVAPTWGVDELSHQGVDRFRGDVAYKNAQALAVTEAYRKDAERLDMARPGHAETIAFHDRYKNGVSQPDPYWQFYAEQVKRPIEDRLHKELEDALNERRQATGNAPSPLAYLENHDRIMWKDPKAAAQFTARFKSLYGDRSMIKQHLLNSMGEGVAQGLEPYKWNIIENDRMAWGSTIHFTEGLKLSKWAIDNGLVEFTRLGDKPSTDSYVAPNTKGWEVYFPAAGGEGLVKAGTWFAHPDFAKLFDNYNSIDRVREYSAARAFLGWRAAVGQVSLFGSFHALTMTRVAMAQQLSLGIRGLAGGLVHGDLHEAMEGARDFARSPQAAISQYRTGRLAQEGAVAPDMNAWLQTPRGQKLLSLYPNAGDLLHLMWHTGGENFVRTPEMMQNKLYDAWIGQFKKAGVNLAQGRVLHAAGHAAAAAAGTAFPIPLLSGIMRPLFEDYIPAMKMGQYLQDVSTSLKDKSGDIQSGRTTREEVSRGVVRRVEDLAGEYNTNNLYLNKTAQALLTAYYRSFGWLFGTAESLGHASLGQLDEFKRAATDPGYRPKINPDMASWLGYLGTAMVLNGVGTYLATKTAPQGKDFIAMRTPYGRFWTPGYESTLYSMYTNPGGIATGHQSDLLSHMMESFKNEDSSFAYISEPTDSHLMKFAKLFGHAVSPFDAEYSYVNVPGLNAPYPLPGSFMLRNFKRVQELGVPASQALGAVALGLSPASKRLDMTAAEERAQDLSTAMRNYGPFTQDQLAQHTAETALSNAVRVGKDYSPEMEAAMNARLSSTQISNAFDRALEPYLESETKRLDLKGALAVGDAAVGDEKDLVLPIIAGKLGELEKFDPKEQQELLNHWYRLASNGGSPADAQ